MYIENPKTKGSGIVCCISQKGRCPNNCKECFFQSGKSYLEPLDKNLPNMPSLKQAKNKVVRVNDGNDSYYQSDKVIRDTQCYPLRFYNTSHLGDISTFNRFKEPVVVTINPGSTTDSGFNNVVGPIPINLMFVRFRTNTWNLRICDVAVNNYTRRGIPIILTFMAYNDSESIPQKNRTDYILRKRTLNEYYAITTEAWRKVMNRYKDNKLVYSCGKIEGENGDTKCKYCGNCIREYFATKCRMEEYINENN